MVPISKGYIYGMATAIAFSRIQMEPQKEETNISSSTIYTTGNLREYAEFVAINGPRQRSECLLGANRCRK